MKRARSERTRKEDNGIYYILAGEAHKGRQGSRKFQPIHELHAARRLGAGMEQWFGPSDEHRANQNIFAIVDE